MKSMDENKTASADFAEPTCAMKMNPNDDNDMQRIGKTQQFRRNFQLASILAFSVITISGWVYVPSTVEYGLASGQTGGLFTMYMVSFGGLFLVVLCLAEMASIAPTAGGQYHWASEFAPASLQKIVSYAIGWLSSLAWLSGTCGGMYPAGFTLQGLILLANPDFDARPYQAYLFVVAIATSGLLVNSLLARYLPMLEGFVFVLFSISFLVFIVVLWTLPPHLTAAEVFQTFEASTGWGLGLSMLTSQSNLLFLIIGSDSTAHMAEETRNASSVIPKAMVGSYIINGVFTLVMIITYSFCLVDYDAVVANSPTGQLGLPFLQIFANGVGSVNGGLALAAVLAVLQIFGTMNYMATCSRQIWSFARDKGLPFSPWIAQVDRTGTFPINAVLVVWTFIVLLTLITLGSTTAFDAITSLTMLALFSTYMVSLFCLLWRRLFGGGLTPGPWHLGPMSIPVNILALCYCVYLFIWLPFPVDVPVTTADFNWSWVIYLGVLIIAAVYYVLFARHAYRGPAVDVKPGWKESAELKPR